MTRLVTQNTHYYLQFAQLQLTLGIRAESTELFHAPRVFMIPARRRAGYTDFRAERPAWERRVAFLKQVVQAREPEWRRDVLFAACGSRAMVSLGGSEVRA